MSKTKSLLNGLFILILVSSALGTFSLPARESVAWNR